MILLDTTIAVDHLRGHEAARALLGHILEHREQPAASEIVRFELLAGVRARETDALERFCSMLAWIPVGEEVARIAGALARKYRRAHGGIGDADYLIAATALLYEAELLTTNVRHFPMLETLTAAY
ncbi:MAG: type II toxin-antitoxin system VapC family toxin [Gaiellaceae bacterium]